MSQVIAGLMMCFRRNQDYGQRLVHDLTDEQMTLQPPGDRDLPVNHPAWAFSHLNVYLPVIHAVIQGEPFEDPKGHQFGMDSKPESDSSLYGTCDQIMATWNAGHESVLRLLDAADDSIFEGPVQLERWSQVMPTAGVCLPYLMLNHENMHLGQVSTWRRVMGLPSV